MLIDTDCKELPGTGNRLNEHCMGPIAIVTLDYTGFGYKNIYVKYIDTLVSDQSLALLYILRIN